MHSNTSNSHDDQPDDCLLIAQIQARVPGWKDRFGQLVARHQGALYARCISYLRNPDDAADASQEALFRAYRAIDSFKGDSAFRTWLFAIADNQCHTLARRRSKQLVDEHLRNLMQVHREIQQRPVAIDMAPEASESVHTALRQITPKGRDVLQLRYFAGLSIEEIAGTLGVGLSAAKMRLYRAQDQIAGLIDECALSQAA